MKKLEDLLRQWDAVRNQGRSRSVLRRAADFVRGTATRARNHAGDLERDLLLEMIDAQNANQEQVARLQAASQEQLARLQVSQEQVARLQASTADILGALDVMWSLHAKHEAGGSGGEMANLRDRQEILRVRQTRLEGALADLREELASLGAPSPPALPLTPRDLAELLAGLERDTPAGERPAAVEVSFQDVRAEDLLLAARRHFGGRLSSSGASYRAPNDLWIHADFTAHWSRPVLLENAAARLAPGGRFLLITAPAAGEPPRHEGLILEEDREVLLASGGPVRVLAWRRQAAA